MAKKKEITKEGLEKLLHWADERIRVDVKYRDEVIEFLRAFADGTVPPGTPPPNPPGIPKPPSR